MISNSSRLTSDMHLFILWLDDKPQIMEKTECELIMFFILHYMKWGFILSGVYPQRSYINAESLTL